MNAAARLVRLAGGIRRFVSTPLGAAEADRRIAAGIAGREATFLEGLRDGVYARPESPYRALLLHAGYDLARVAELVGAAGLEAALAQLHRAGVRVTLSEFKRPGVIERPGLRIPVRPEDFDHPLSRPAYRARTSGSRGAPRVVGIDLARVEHEAAYVRHFIDAFGLGDRPVGCWRGVPPVGSGIGFVLRYTKAGKPVERWFAQNRLPWRLDTLEYRLYTEAVVRCAGVIPAPEYVHQRDAVRIARWLAGHAAEGRPAMLDTNASSGVRVCIAAEQARLDISGTLFRLGGEPYSKAKEAVVHRVGASAVCHYSMGELGHLGIACARGRGRDDIHLLVDKVAVFAAAPREGGPPPGALVVTSILPSCAKLMLNVECDDIGRLEQRNCGCPIGDLGLDRLVSGLHSYEKLTSEGMSYLASQVVALLEEELPARFGGYPTQYQLAESEEDGIPVVELVVSPAVGSIDEAAALAVLYERLDAEPGGDLMSGFWREARTVRVARREPHQTASAKVHPVVTL